jgi:hypothetical protein
MKPRHILTASAVAGLSLLAAPATALADGSETPTPTTTTTAPAASPGCTTGTLPAVVLGDPHMHAQAPLGAYLWHDAHGYQLRVTHPGRQKVVVAGVITTSNPIGAVNRLRFERADHAVVSGDRHKLTFRVTNYGGVDGLRFTADCSGTVRVSVAIGGKPAPTSQVFLGAKRTHPTSVPFTIERSA